MDYLSTIKINKEPSERLKKLAGRTLNLLPGINLLVGENGIGKSSILRDLNDNVISKKSTKITTTGALSTFFFDTERMNPRIKNHVDSGLDIALRFVSHGECLSAILTQFKELIKDKSKSYVLFIDEPESGLSPWKQKELLDLYVKHSKRVQMVIATHSLIFTRAKVGRLIELSTDDINYFDPPCSYNWNGLQ